MTYLFTNNQEIKNDIGNPIPISANTTTNSNTNPLHVTGPMTINGTVTTSLLGGASKETAFGELYGITVTPVIQLDAIYGTTSEVIQTYASGTGAVANGTNGLYTVSSGTSVGGYGVLRSKRFLRYRPGQGALARFTAAFTPNTALTSQRAGLFNQENGLMVGWNDSGTGPKFGVMRASGGKAEIRQLTINSISAGSQTLTVTLNGTSHNVTVDTANTTTAAVAIAAAAQSWAGWLIDQVDNTIVFLSSGLGALTGTFSLTGSGTVSGTFTRRQAGAAQTERWTYQGDFTDDNLDGTGPSGMTLHSEYLNVYQINYRWLGAGEIRYAIEDQATGQFIFFHKEHYTNQHSVPHTLNPSFKIGYVAYSTGSNTSVTVTSASMMGAIEGDIRQNELNRSTSVSKTGLNSGSIHHLMTIRNPYVTNGKAGAHNGDFVLNTKEINFKDISIGVQGNDPGIVHLFYEPTSFNNTHVYTSQPKDNGMMSTVDGTLDKTVDTSIARFVTAINGESQYKLSDFRVVLPPGSAMSIAIESTSNMSRVSMAMVFAED